MQPVNHPYCYITASVLLALTVAPAMAADHGAVVVPQEVLNQIVDDNPNPLPRSKTSYELLFPVPIPTGGDVSPAGEIFTPSEYQENRGLLIRWGSFNDVLTAMTVGISTGDPDGIVYVFVEGTSQENSARNVLTNAGADMDQVIFIQQNGDSVWMRDYGPRFVWEDEVDTMIDHTYNRPTRPGDNMVPDHLTNLWGTPQYDIPLTHGGGNFHLFANGDAFMTELILDENPGLSEAEVDTLYLDYQNLDLNVVGAFPSWYDATQHIDMWMLPIDDNNALVGEYSSTSTVDAVPYDVTESTVTILESKGYNVFRTPGWYSGGTHYTYTNSVIFNKLVFICEFNGYAADNAAAFATYEAAFPDHQIIPVNCSQIITFAGAIHCIVMHVPEVDLIFRDPS